MLGTSGKVLNPVKFKIHGTLMGVPSSRIVDGIYETRKLTEIAMLRRLPPSRAEEITGDIVMATPIEQVVASASEPIEEKSWSELMQLATDAGFYYVGMKKVDVIAGLKALQAREGISIA